MATKMRSRSSDWRPFLETSALLTGTADHMHLGRAPLTPRRIACSWKPMDADEGHIRQRNLTKVKTCDSHLESRGALVAVAPKDEMAFRAGLPA